MRGMCCCSCAEALLNVDCLSKTMFLLQFMAQDVQAIELVRLLFKNFNVTVGHIPGGGCYRTHILTEKIDRQIF